MLNKTIAVTIMISENDKPVIRQQTSVQFRFFSLSILEYIIWVSRRNFIFTIALPVFSLGSFDKIIDDMIRLKLIQ